MMDLNELFARFEIEFEIDLPQDAETSLLTVHDVSNCVRSIYRTQGIEASAGAILERVRNIASLVTRVSTMDIEQQTKLADLVRSRPFRAA